MRSTTYFTGMEQLGRKDGHNSKEMKDDAGKVKVREGTKTSREYDNQR